MNTSKFKVVVVGGGPAGSSAAKTLSASGIDVCLIDKSPFPRDKLCGGLLTLRSQKAFQKIFKVDWSSVMQANSKGARFYYQHELLNSVENYKDIFFTRRSEYDAFLLESARQSGTQVLLGKPVQSVNFENSSLTLSDGDEIEYDVLIGADGVNSVVAKSIFGNSFAKEKIGFGLEMEVPISPKVLAINDPEIHFGILDWGYGWVFPKKSTLTAGVGGLLKVNPKMRDAFDVFLKKRFGHVPAAKVKGHFIPFGDFRKTPGKRNVLLCGDAAGLVEPITGEGIAFAMLSGYYAAESAREALAKSNRAAALDLYAIRYAEIANTFTEANKLRQILIPKFFQYLFSKVLPRSESIPRKQMDLMADDISYDEYTRFLIKKGISGPFKSLFRR